MMDKDGNPTSPLPQTPDEVRELVKKLHEGEYTVEQLYHFVNFAFDMGEAWHDVAWAAEVKKKSQC